MKSIFVGNLPWSVTDEELNSKFSEFVGVTSARVIKDKTTGRSRGFGFVDMDDSEIEKAVKLLHGADWDGRSIVVNEARPKER